jgi:hypothetical protein
MRCYGLGEKSDQYSGSIPIPLIKHGHAAGAAAGDLTPTADGAVIPTASSAVPTAATRATAADQKLKSAQTVFCFAFI